MMKCNLFAFGFALVVLGGVLTGCSSESTQAPPSTPVPGGAAPPAANAAAKRAEAEARARAEAQGAAYSKSMQSGGGAPPAGAPR